MTPEEFAKWVMEQSENGNCTTCLLDEHCSTSEYFCGLAREVMASLKVEGVTPIED